jgi:catechol 2,3-dioxygenase-like lactoylglutathione lyase family enzyme
MHEGSVHHVAIGVRSLKTMKAFYQNILEFNKVFLEFEESEHEIMHEVLRTSHVVFSGIIFNQEEEGILVELIKMTNPVPRAVRKDFRYGDIGVSKITIPVSDLDYFYRELGDKIVFCSKPKLANVPGWGDYYFVYLRDPEGNLIELISMKSGRSQNRLGGVRSVGIGVTDLKRSMSFYRKHLGLDRVVIDSHESFSGLVDEVSCGNRTQVRSCVLANSKGSGTIELIEVMKPRGRSIPFATNFGDFGYLQVCLYCNDIEEVAAYCEKEGIEVLSRPQLMDDGIPEHKGSFLYAKDPDGIPIEFLVLHHPGTIDPSRERI